jgi:hypothetical protein
MIDEPDKMKFLEWMNNVLSRKEIELQARAKLLNDAFSKVRQLDQEDVDAFNFYEIGMEVEYLDEHFETIHFDRLLFHDGFFDNVETKAESTSSNESKCQLMKRLMDHFKGNEEKLYEIKYFWYSLKLNEDQLLT